MEVNITQAMKRSKRIDSVEQALNEVLGDKNLLFDGQKFAILISEQFNCSDRTAKEYIKIAKSRTENG